MADTSSSQSAFLHGKSGVGQPVLLNTTTKTTSSGNITSGTISPTGNSLILAILSTTHAGTPPTTNTPTDTLTGTGTWTKQIEEQDTDIGAWGMTVVLWTAKAGSSPGSGTITITQDIGTGNRKVLHVFEIPTGFDETNQIVNTKGGANVSTSASLTLDATPRIGSIVMGAMSTGDDSDDDVTPGSGYNEIAEENLADISPADITHQVQFKNKSLSTTVDWSGLGTTHNVYIGFEIQSSVQSKTSAFTEGVIFPRITQYALEVLAQPDTVEPRVTQYALEVLIKPSKSSKPAYMFGVGSASSSTPVFTDARIFPVVDDFSGTEGEDWSDDYWRTWS